MEQRAARGHQIRAMNLADLVVRELEAALGLLQDASTHQLLDAISRLVLLDAGGVLEERELEPAPDDGGHVEQAAPTVGERAQAPGDEVAHTGGHESFPGSGRMTALAY